MAEGFKLSRLHTGAPGECYTEELIENALLTPIREQLMQHANGKALAEMKILFVGTIKCDTDERTYTVCVGNKSSNPIPWMAEALKIIIADDVKTMDDLMERVLDVALTSLKSVAQEGIVRMINNQHEN